MHTVGCLILQLEVRYWSARVLRRRRRGTEYRFKCRLQPRVLMSKTFSRLFHLRSSRFTIAWGNLRRSHLFVRDDTCVSEIEISWINCILGPCRIPWLKACPVRISSSLWPRVICLIPLLLSYVNVANQDPSGVLPVTYRDIATITLILLP